MMVNIIQVPYDSGLKNVRQGLGPGRFIERKIDTYLKEKEHEVIVTCIESKDNFPTEVGTAFELNRYLAEQVKKSIKEKFFPLVLSGNCGSCLGIIAGIHLNSLGVIWLDAHGEFNTPETTNSGWLDGMPLSMATGRCWKMMLKSIPGFIPVSDPNIILIGARDLDEMEAVQLAKSDINVIESEGFDENDIFEKIKTAIRRLGVRVNDVYLHIDMDTVDTGQHSSNHLHSSGGLRPRLIEEIIGMIKERFDLKAACLASYDPSFDKDDRSFNAGRRFINKIAADGF